MAALLYQLFTSTTLISLGIYHLISTVRNHLKSPNRDYIAKLHHPLPLLRFKHLQLYLLIFCLLLAFFHQVIVSSDSDPLLKGRTPVHKFTSLQSAAVLFLFILLSVSVLISEVTSFLPFPPDLFFAVASSVFFLQYSVSSSSAVVQTSDLQAKCDYISALISGLCSFVCLLLACNMRMFVADVALGAALVLQGLWALQTGLSMYVEAFIPEGCHRLLDVVSGVEGSTKCDLEESKLRAVAILELAFVGHVTFVVFIVFVVYGILARTFGIRRHGSYEALPSVSDSSINHIQMKALAGTQA